MAKNVLTVGGRVALLADLNWRGTIIQEDADGSLLVRWDYNEQEQRYQADELTPELFGLEVWKFSTAEARNTHSSEGEYWKAVTTAGEVYALYNDVGGGYVAFRDRMTHEWVDYGAAMALLGDTTWQGLT